MSKVYRDYAEVDEAVLSGYIVAGVLVGINACGSGMQIELERQIDNVTIGIDLIYDPEHGENETELMISSEYVKTLIPNAI